MNLNPQAETVKAIEAKAREHRRCSFGGKAPQNQNVGVAAPMSWP